jgi:hypothetical protein
VSGKGHSRLFAIATALWVAFWVAGLPDYYQQYSTAAMISFEVVLLVGVLGLVQSILRKIPAIRRRQVAFWNALYFTATLAFYDWLYCGLYLGHGMAFLWRYWYVTTFYVIPWFVFPGVASALDAREVVRVAPPGSTAGKGLRVNGLP